MVPRSAEVVKVTDIALVTGRVLVTANTAHSQHSEGLSLED